MFTRSLTCLCALLVSTSTLSAQSSVWKITKGGNTLYLGGTCHVLRPSDFPLPSEFDAAFAASAKLFFETDIARMQSAELREAIAAQGMFAGDTTLETVLTPAAWKTVEAYCTRAGIPLAQAKRMKPWLFTVMTTMMEVQKLGVSMEGVDLHYFKEATTAGKKTGALETFERHVALLTQMGAGHESEMVANSLEELGELPAKLADLLTAWRAGNLPKLDTLMLEEMRTKYPSIFKALLVDRNQAWLPKLEALLQSPEIEFVLVGVGHLAGKEGLIAELRARGCTIEQMKAPPAATK